MKKINSAETRESMGSDANAPKRGNGLSPMMRATVIMLSAFIVILFIIGFAMHDSPDSSHSVMHGHAVPHAPHPPGEHPHDEPKLTLLEDAGYGDEETEKTNKKTHVAAPTKPAKAAGKYTMKGCVFDGPKDGFMWGCVQDCKPYQSLDNAAEACRSLRECGGVVQSSAGSFELRVGPALAEEKSASNEKSYVKQVMTECNNVPIPSTTPGEFWAPPKGTDLDSIGTFVNGKPTIFLSVAAYRDEMCHRTITHALTWAEFPERLTFGVVQQQVDGVDTPCLWTPKPCSEDPEQMICKYKHNIRVDEVDAKQARGPTYGRHRADKLYRGEYYVLQIDAHMYFVKHWDSEVIKQFVAAKNDYAVMSTYPSESKHNVHKGLSRIRTTPGICLTSFLGDGLLRHGAAGEFVPDVRKVKDPDEPVLGAWWAAGLSFSRGHRVVRVPYDCCTPMTFNGEEFSMAFRMWTWGYDMYTFRRVIALHPYARKKRPVLFWENNNRFPMDAERSARRLQQLFGMRTPNSHLDYDHTDMKKYGVGPKRPLSKFLKVFGIDFKRKTTTNLCSPIQTSRVHEVLTAYLRPDGKGIDYTDIPDDVSKQWHRRL